MIGAVYDIPQGEGIVLDVTPRVASWMQRNHPDQLRLKEFFDHAEAAVRPVLARLKGPLALRLDVALPERVDPLYERDLDNYLYPLVSQLGPERFVSVWGTKQLGGSSMIRIEPARPAILEDEWQVRHARSDKSAASLAWKREIQVQLQPVDPLPDGAAALQVSFTAGPRRNWTNLWKPVVDTLDPILGRSFPGREWHPQDGRVVCLGLHRAIDRTAEHAVQLVVRWPEAPLDWPEHASRALSPHDQLQQGSSNHDRDHGDVPEGMEEPAGSLGVWEAPHVGETIRELRTVEEFRVARRRRTPILIIDTARKPVLYLRQRGERQCVREEWFNQKVVENRGRNGRYYLVMGEATAQAQ